MSPRQSFSKLRNYLRVALSDPALARDTLRKLKTRVQRAKGREGQKPRQIDFDDTPRMTAREVVRQVSQSIAVVMLSNAKRTAKVGVADVDFADAVTLIQTMVPHARIYLDQDRFSGDPTTLGRTAQDAEKVSFAFPGRKGRPNLIEIEMYEQRDADLWVSKNTSNIAGRALYLDPFQKSGTHASTAVLGGQTIEEKMDRLPVDVVVSWVNHEDSDWQVQFNQHVANADITTDASAISRFSSRGELRFCLRSVVKYLPWVRHIYVVSNCAPPTWMNVDHKRITWVDHSDIATQAFLPTFNSHVVETYLHHIPTLSEHFIYLNDDMFVCRPQPKGRFFNANETSCSFMQPYGMVTGNVTAGAPDYLNASRNSATMLSDALGYRPTQLHEHAPYALRRSVLSDIEDQFGDAIDKTREAKFRSKSDINLTSFFYHHFAFWQTKATFEQVDAVMLRNKDLRWKTELARVAQDGCDFLCVNEGGTHKPSAAWHADTSQYLRAKFPDIAPWETS